MRVWRLFARISEASKKPGEWLYANKWEEMGHAPKGRIFVMFDTGPAFHAGRDTHNCTLRMLKALEETSLVLAYDQRKVTGLLAAIAEKSRFVQDSHYQALEEELSMGQPQAA